MIGPGEHDYSYALPVTRYAVDIANNFKEEVVPKVLMWKMEISIFFSIIYSFDRKFFLCYMFYVSQKRESFAENQGMTKVLGISKISKIRKFLIWLTKESGRLSFMELLMGDEIKEILKKRFQRKI